MGVGVGGGFETVLGTGTFAYELVSDSEKTPGRERRGP